MKFFIAIISIACLPFCAYADNVANFILPSGVSVKIIEARFNAADFKIDGCSESDTHCLINGNPPFGTDLNLPKTYVKSITIKYKNQSHSLDVTNMFNAWGSRPLEYEGSVRYFGGNCYDGNNCQLRGLFSDAAGSYVAEWKIINGVSIRTILTSSGDVLRLFIKEIDPPIYE